MDYYDQAVQYFTEHPEEIDAAWGSPTVRLYGQLFAFADKWRTTHPDTYSICGCPSQIRAGICQTTNLAVYNLIFNSRLPSKIFCDLTQSEQLELLPEFARLQREIDIILDREPLSLAEVTV